MSSKLKSDVYDSEDHIYYNVIISNQNDFSIQAEFVENRVQPIIDDPSEYYLSIVRFLVPGQNVPIFVFAPTVYEDRNSKVITMPYNPASPVLLTSTLVPSYSITLSFGGNDYQQFISYNPLTVTSSSEAGYYFVYSYQNMIDMINAAFASAFEAMHASGSPSPATYPPYLTFNPVTQIVTLNAETTAGAYVASTPGGDYVKIYMDNILYSFFESFENFFNSEYAVNGKNYQIIVKNNGTNVSATSNSPDPITFPTWQSVIPYFLNDVVFNPTDNNFYTALGPNLGQRPDLTVGVSWALSPAPPAHYTGAIFQMSQEFPSLYNWNSFRNIVFTTGSIPIQAEYQPSLNGDGAQNYRRILTDFQPVVAQGPDARSYFQYFPQSEYRLVSFTSNQPLRRFDLKIYWESNQNQLFPLLIPPFDEASIKFLFRKKKFNLGALTPENMAEALKNLV